VDSLRVGATFIARNGETYKFTRRDGALLGVYHVQNIKSGEHTSFAGCAEVEVVEEVQ
jgi:hypothetical protein